MQSSVQVVTSHCRIPPHSTKQAVLWGALHQPDGQAAAGFAGPTRQARVIRREDANQKSFLDITVPFLVDRAYEERLPHRLGDLYDPIEYSKPRRPKREGKFIQ